LPSLTRDFREGQHPDLGNSAVNPSDAGILEDLEILVDHGFRLIRMYDAREITATASRLILDTTLFWLGAFDEPSKGDEDDPRVAEKHRGLFFVGRTPKLVFRERRVPGK
jgi:hypothetical protein